MSSLVSIELRDQDGEVLSQAQVRPPYRIPIGDVTIRERSTRKIVLSLRRRAGAFARTDRGEEFGDAPIGSIPLLSTREDGRGLEVVPLTLIPPKPLTAQEVDTMWQCANRLPAVVPRSVRRDGVSAARATVGGRLGLYIDPVPQLTSLARHAATRWPPKESTETGWRPVDLPGGREDVRGSMARPLTAGFAKLPSGRVVPEKSLRRRTTVEPWRLGVLGAVVQAVIHQLIDGDVDEADLVTAFAPLAEVARLAGSTGGAIDPAISSWPSVLRRLYELSTVVLAGVSAAGIGTDRAPLAHLWELYEAWVSAAIIDVVSDELGMPSHQCELGLNSQGRPAWRVSWDVPPIEVEVYGQAEFRVVAPNFGLPVRSVTASLIPDCTIVIRRDGVERLVAVDAKFRGNKTMTAGDINQAASPYLWSLRQASDPKIHALEHTLIVASGPVSKVHSPLQARMSAVTATPQSGAALPQVLRLILAL